MIVVLSWLTTTCAWLFLLQLWAVVAILCVRFWLRGRGSVTIGVGGPILRLHINRFVYEITALPLFLINFGVDRAKPTFYLVTSLLSLPVGAGFLLHASAWAPDQGSVAADPGARPMAIIQAADPDGPIARAGLHDGCAIWEVKGAERSSGNALIDLLSRGDVDTEVVASCEPGS